MTDSAVETDFMHSQELNGNLASGEKKQFLLRHLHKILKQMDREVQRNPIGVINKQLIITLTVQGTK